MEISEDSYINTNDIGLSDKWFALIVEKCQLGIFIYKDSKVIWINNWLNTFLNQPQENIIGRSVKDFINGLMLCTAESDKHDIIEYSTSESSHRQMAIYDSSTQMYRLEVLIDEVTDGDNKFGFGIVADISNFKVLQRELQDSQEQVELGRTALQKKKIAFDEVLNSMEDYKSKIIVQLTNYLEQKVSPVLRQLKASATESQIPLVDLLEEDIKAISVDFSKRMASKWGNLTSRELQVCHMIRNGYSSKEIADALGLCLSTIHKHRETIRKKLGIRNKHVNLNSYLRKI